MPNHNFDSKIDNQHSFESKIENQHRFDSIINIIRYFEGIVDAGYFNPDFWKASFVNAINITVGTIASSMKFSASVVVIPISMTVDRFLVNVRISPTAEFISNTTMLAILKMAVNFGTVSFQTSQTIQAIMRDILKINSVSLTIPQVSIGATIIAKQYYMLNNWDASLLSTLDTMNLSDMDYQIV